MAVSWEDVIAKLGEARDAQTAVRAAATTVQEKSAALTAAQGEAESARAAERAASDAAAARFDELTALIADLRAQS